MTMDHNSAQSRRNEARQAMQTIKKEITTVEHRILNAMTVLYVLVPLLLILGFVAEVVYQATTLMAITLALLMIASFGILARVQPLRREKRRKEDDLADEEVRYRYFYLKAQIYSTLDRSPEDYPPEIQHIRKRRQSRRLESLMDDAKASRDKGEISQEAYDELIRTVLFEGE